MSKTMEAVGESLQVSGRQFYEACLAGFVGATFGTGIGMTPRIQTPEDAWTYHANRLPRLENTSNSSDVSLERDDCATISGNRREFSFVALSGVEPRAGTQGGPILDRNGTDDLFARLAKARSPRRMPEFLTLIRSASPRLVLEVALSQYELYGYEGRLSLASELLGEMGNEGWKALRGFCETNRSECAYFVDAVAAFRGVRRLERIGALGQLATNPDPDVRDAVLNSQRYRPDCRDASILDKLWTSGDDDVRAEVEHVAGSHSHVALTA